MKLIKKEVRIPLDKLDTEIGKYILNYEISMFKKEVGSDIITDEMITKTTDENYVKIETEFYVITKEESNRYEKLVSRIKESIANQSKLGEDSEDQEERHTYIHAVYVLQKLLDNENKN